MVEHTSEAAVDKGDYTVCVHVCACVNVHACVCVCCVYACACVHVCVDVCMHVCVHVCVLNRNMCMNFTEVNR